MNLDSADQHPALQVFLSDTPEAPKPNANFHLSTQEPIAHFQEYIFGESTIKCHYLYGKNITACFSACFMVDEEKIYTIPAQPVVAFHIQVSGDCLARVGNRQEESRYTKGQCRLFWQNDHTLEYILIPTESDHFDLYIRPGHLLDMADRYPVLREFAMAVATSSSSDIQFFIDRIDQQLLDSIDEILREVKNYQVSDQRFTHLCECLLLQWLDIPVEVEGQPTGAVKRTFDSAFAHLEDDVFSEEQNSHLWTIARYYNRNQLIDNFYEAKQEYLRLKQDRAESKALEKEVKACYHRVMGESADLLAEAYFWIAQQLDEQKERFSLTEGEKQTLAEAIITVCDRSFELRTPSADQLELYTSYTGQPYAGDLGLQEFGRILNRIVPNLDLPPDKLDESKEGGAIMDQYLQDRLGFTPLSHFTEKGEMDKPPKVVELYHTLMQRMTDELMITDTGDIKKSDLIRILDHAYQQNDVIMLLLFEIDHLTDQEDYVKSQKFNKISAWLMVLDEANEKWYDQSYSSKQDELFGHLKHVYMRSGNEMEAVAQQVRETKDIYDRMVPALPDVGYAMESQTKKHMLMLLAESLIIAAQNPFEEGRT
ncbi:MAG: hypothetical protein LBF27_05705 [Sphingobacterium sp.]|jgi:hypothetical protein|nr:hypothetical protein [Sphingobacterium sp.]